MWTDTEHVPFVMSFSFCFQKQKYSFFVIKWALLIFYVPNMWFSCVSGMKLKQLYFLWVSFPTTCCCKEVYVYCTSKLKAFPYVFLGCINIAIFMKNDMLQDLGFCCVITVVNGTLWIWWVEVRFLLSFLVVIAYKNVNNYNWIDWLDYSLVRSFYWVFLCLCPIFYILFFLLLFLFIFLLICGVLLDVWSTFVLYDHS